MAIKQPKPQPGYQLRHRLTGAVIIVTFAVVIIPYLLHSPAPAESEPIGDDMDSVVIEPGDPVVIEPPVPVEPPVTEPDQAQPPAEELTAPAPAPQPGPVWFVRVGTYGSIRNVNTISKLLEDNGFEARHTEVQTNNAKAVRVWLGPYHDREKAEQARLQARALTHEKVYVTDQAP